MKKLLTFLFVLLTSITYGQDNITISFSNDSKAVYHLSLVIYTPDGKIQTRVSDLTSGQVNTYSLPVNTEIFIADQKQEAFAMKGNDIKSTGIKPYIVLNELDDKKVITLSLIQ
ncbi:MAG: hypothetical protein KA513_04630 [Flavobacterium sp.]|nr:hypothetical protein [Flavobacterium sp.]MBP6073328.1 hypothetical protein [Flavobacterium sp.]